MLTGAESPVTSSPDREDRPVLSRSGRDVAYQRIEGSQESIYISDLASGRARRLCPDCGEPRDWSADDSRILCLRSGALFWIESATGRRTGISVPADCEPAECSLSPDGRWLALVTGIKGKKGYFGFIVPLHEALADRSQWIPITEELYELAVHWAPGGNRLYYFRTADGFRCLYTRRLDAFNKKPVGPPVAIHHFHRNQRYPLNGSWIAVAPQMLVMNLAEQHANIWRATLPQ
jgi:hypothetical protein